MVCAAGFNPNSNPYLCVALYMRVREQACAKGMWLADHTFFFQLKLVPLVLQARQPSNCFSPLTARPPIFGGIKKKLTKTICF